MSEKSEKIKGAILRTLTDASGPVGAEQIKSSILSMGVDLQPRMVRYYLMQFDKQGFTKLMSRRLGRVITDAGREEAARLNIPEMAKIVASQIDTLGYRMTYDGTKGQGSVILNVSLIDPADISIAVKEMQLVVDRGLSFSEKIIIAGEGGRIGNVIVPEGMLGIGTVCSITLNGVLQKKGIPVISRFGGLLEVRNGQYVRFMNVIEYRGSSLDPLEVFIKADMTGVRDVVLRGSGIICASFREIPAIALNDLEKIHKFMKKRGLGGILAVGRPSQSLLGVPVSPGYCGLIVTGGVNPVAAVHETGVRVSLTSLAGLEEYDRLKTVRQAAREV
ncbi:DUF128 domain-containing protein [Verrucomicrobiota bacterium]